mgnify:CR=1 FL=1
MEIEEYKKQRWGAGMKALYNGTIYDIDSCNFPEFLIGLNDGSDELFWVRCENIELLSKEN